jgi:hypothetical protein
LGVACYTYGERRYAYRALVGSLNDRDCLEDLGLDGMMILKHILKKSGWMALANVRNKWRALVNAV